MEPIIYDCEQRTIDWFKARRSVTITASEMGEFLIKGDKRSADARAKHIARKISEPIYADQDRVDAAWLADWKDREVSMLERNAAIQRGNLFEGMARQAYADATGTTPEKVGFVAHPDGICGASPDLVHRLAMNVILYGCEMKCPLPETHIRYVLDGVLPEEYKHQVHGSMVATGCNRWDFFSYCPGLPHLLVTVKRDQFTEDLEKGCESLHEQLKKSRAEMGEKARQQQTPAPRAA